MNILCCIKMPPDYLQKTQTETIPGHKSSHVDSRRQILYYAYLMISQMMK